MLTQNIAFGDMQKKLKEGDFVIIQFGKKDFSLIPFWLNFSQTF